MNRTLKETLTKLALETSMNWEALSPFFLFRIRNFPYQMGLTPFRIMFGIPQPLSFPVYRQTFWWSWMTKSSLTLYEESSGHTSMCGQHLGPFINLVSLPNPTVSSQRTGSTSKDIAKEC